MMIDVVVNPDFLGNFGILYTHMNPLTAGATMVSASATAIVFADGAGHSYTLTGTDLVWGLDIHGKPAVMGGAAYALSYAEGAATLVTFSVLQTTGAAVWEAFVAEQSGKNPGALTDLLVHHCWTYTGTEHADIFTMTTLADRGLLDPHGMDLITLGGGNDNWFTGSNNDTVFGGAGNDTIDGGSDDDRLFGGAGNDVSYGGLGNDFLQNNGGRDSMFGGDGRDTLLGSAGNDTLTGGAGDDSLNGGKGSDVFVFEAGSGNDTLTGFEDGIDHFRITSAASVEIIDQGANTLIRFGTDQVLVMGIDATHFSSGDFL